MRCPAFCFPLSAFRLQDPLQTVDCLHKLRLIINADDPLTARKPQRFDDARIVQLVGEGLCVVVQATQLESRRWNSVALEQLAFQVSLGLTGSLDEQEG